VIKGWVCLPGDCSSLRGLGEETLSVTVYTEGPPILSSREQSRGARWVEVEVMPASAVERLGDLAPAVRPTG
jgi:hypothetical protein